MECLDNKKFVFWKPLKTLASAYPFNQRKP